MEIRRAGASDLDAVSDIYSLIHTEEENGRISIGWVRNIYPTRQTAAEALKRGDLFVEQDGKEIVGTAIINQAQPEAYRMGNWQYPAEDNHVMVLHTLVIKPGSFGKGYGRKFVCYYEDYARSHGYNYLRIDTQEKNRNARAMYRKMGYREVGVVQCDFNGIRDIDLVLLEKRLV